MSATNSLQFQSSAPSNKENHHSVAVSSKLQPCSSSSSSSSNNNNSPVPPELLQTLNLHSPLPLRTNCRNPVSWTLSRDDGDGDDDDDDDDECQAAEILTSMHNRPMSRNETAAAATTANDNEPHLVQSDSMDGHVDPVSCQLMQEMNDDELDDDHDDGMECCNEHGRSENDSMQIKHHNSNCKRKHLYEHEHEHEQSPPAPRRLTPSDKVQRPLAHRLQLFRMPSSSAASYSFDEFEE